MLHYYDPTNRHCTAACVRIATNHRSSLDALISWPQALHLLCHHQVYAAELPLTVAPESVANGNYWIISNRNGTLHSYCVQQTYAPAMHAWIIVIHDPARKAPHKLRSDDNFFTSSDILETYGYPVRAFHLIDCSDKQTILGV